MSSENQRVPFLRRVFDFVRELRPKPKPIELDDDLVFWINSLGERGKERSLQRHYLVFSEMFKGYIQGTKQGVNLARSITDTASSYTPVTGEFVRNQVYGGGEAKIADYFKEQITKELRFADKKGLSGNKSLLIRWMTVFCVKELVDQSIQSSIPDQAQSFRFVARKLFFIGVEESSRLSGIKVDGAFAHRVAREILSSEASDLVGNLNIFLTAPPTRE